MTITDKILNIIFPPVCGFCNEINDEFLCEKCRKKFELIKTSKIDNYENDPVYFDEHFYMFKYEKDVREYILKYKFNEKSYMYKSFAKLITEDKIFKEILADKIDCIVNAANEVVNLAFRQDKCSFTEMGDIIEKTMQKVTFDATPDLDVYLQTDKEARCVATEMLRA